MPAVERRRFFGSMERGPGTSRRHSRVTDDDDNPRASHDALVVEPPAASRRARDVQRRERRDLAAAAAAATATTRGDGTILSGRRRARTVRLGESVRSAARRGRIGAPQDGRNGRVLAVACSCDRARRREGECSSNALVLVHLDGARAGVEPTDEPPAEPVGVARGEARVVRLERAPGVFVTVALRCCGREQIRICDASSSFRDLEHAAARKTVRRVVRAHERADAHRARVRVLHVLPVHREAATTDDRMTARVCHDLVTVLPEHAKLPPPTTPPTTTRARANDGAEWRAAKAAPPSGLLSSEAL